MIRGVGEGVAKIVGDLEKTLKKLVDPKVHSQWTNSSEPATPFLIVALPSGLQIYRVAPYFRDIDNFMVLGTLEIHCNLIQQKTSVKLNWQ